MINSTYMRHDPLGLLGIAPGEGDRTALRPECQRGISSLRVAWVADRQENRGDAFGARVNDQRPVC
jgi:hypothetical protein